MKIGESAEASLVVQPSDTARVLSRSPDDVFPEVFATSRMIALMELAAGRLMRPLASTCGPSSARSGSSRARPDAGP